VKMREACEARGIRCDIEWDEDKRIYGDAWVDFVASCRATLGTESGSNVFDFDGSLTARINAALKANPRTTYEEVEAKYLGGLERDGVMNQVSPRIFEAVALRTGLVLFEGTYSGVVRPDEHFIPLKKDFSNVDDVLRQVQDDRELSAMTERAYRHVFGSGRYTYEAFAREVDAAMEKHAGPGRLADLPPASDGWTREVPHPKPGGPAGRLARFKQHPTVRFGYRAARFAARGVYRASGVRTVRLALRRRRGAAALIAADPDLADLPRPEALRLALLRHVCNDCPTVLTRTWASIRYEPDRGRLTFTSHPAHDLPGGIGPGRPVLDRALAAIRSRAIREIGWEFAGVVPKVTVKVDNVGVVGFEFGPDRVFRFTALERLADLDPERAARLVGRVAEGASAPAEAAAEECYRRAS
jgi:hypothetical protein